MEKTEAQNEITSGGHESTQTAEAKAHHYDASKYDRPSVTVDVVMMSLRQRDLQVLLIKRRSWPYEGMWAIPGGFVNRSEEHTSELQSLRHLVCRLLLEKKKKNEMLDYK